MKKELIKQILLEQKEEIIETFKERLIERECAFFTDKILESNFIKVIMGVRRCGKSVLAHLLLKGKRYGYVNFDDERFIGIKAAELNDFLELLNEIGHGFKYLFLDEIQNIEGWELFVNRLKRKGYNLIISGSNSELLSKELATHLTGRHLSIELYPFSFGEFLSYRGFSVQEKYYYITEKRALIKRFLTEYLALGGFPEIFKIDLKGNYLRELYDRIISRDILLRYSVKYVKALKEIALFGISNFANRISYHKVKRIFDMGSVHTVKNYLNYLEESYLLFTINNFSFKLKEQLIASKKIYCIDSGLIQAIVSKNSLDYGRLMENVVFLELRRRAKEIYFYSKPDYEVDFLIKERLKVSSLIQVCYSIDDEKTKKREIDALIKASRDLKCNNVLVITWDTEEEEKVNGKKIRYIPLWKWLLA